MCYKCLNLEAAAKFITGSGKNKTMFFSQYPLDAGTKNVFQRKFQQGGVLKITVAVLKGERQRAVAY